MMLYNNIMWSSSHSSSRSSCRSRSSRAARGLRCVPRGAEHCAARGLRRVPPGAERRAARGQFRALVFECKMYCEARYAVVRPLFILITFLHEFT